MKGLIAKKVGMTQVFDENGSLTPVTVIRVEPNTVIARKTKETAGYDAVVLGLDDLKKNKVSKSYAGQFPENIAPKRYIRYFLELLFSLSPLKATSTTDTIIKAIPSSQIRLIFSLKYIAIIIVGIKKQKA